MNFIQYYLQCRLKKLDRGRGRYIFRTTWIKIELAEPGKKIMFKDKSGGYDKGWEVVNAWGLMMTKQEIEEQGEERRKMKKTEETEGT